MKKKIISVDEFNAYSGNYEDSEEQRRLKDLIIDAAQTVVEDYLGYKLLEDNYVEDYVGTGSRKLYLHAKPITYVNDLIVNKKHLVQDVDFITNSEFIVLLEGVFEDNAQILVDYCSGVIPERVPAIVKETVLRIATLMLMEAGENIGITSKSFSDNSRTFLNYQDYSKYLRPLGSLRIVRV